MSLIVDHQRGRSTNKILAKARKFNVIVEINLYTLTEHLFYLFLPAGPTNLKVMDPLVTYSFSKDHIGGGI